MIDSPRPTADPSARDASPPSRRPKHSPPRASPPAACGGSPSAPDPSASAAAPPSPNVGLQRKMSQTGIQRTSSHHHAAAKPARRTRCHALWLHPDGAARKAIDGAVALLVMWSVYSVPLFLGFDVQLQVRSAEWWAEAAVDLAFLLEMAANFRTGIWWDGAAQPCYDDCIVGSAYLRGWFAVDAASTIPNVLSDLLQFVAHGSDEEAFRYFGLLRAVRLTKLLRLVKLNRVVMRYADLMSLRATHLVQGMVLVGHLLGCFLHFIVLHEPSCASSANATAAERDEVCTWVDLLPSTGDFQRYVASLYWAFAAMSTVGYGDLVPVTIAEAGAVLVVEFAGVLSFACVVGTVTSLTATSRKREAFVREKMDFVVGYMREHHLKRELQVRIRKFYEYSLHHRPLPDVQLIMTELSTTIREQLAYELYGKYQALFPLLQRKTLSFVAWIGPRLQAFYALRGEYVQYADVIPLDMYWLVTGSLEVLSGDLAETLYILQPGDTYGEIPIIEGTRHGVTLRAREWCDMLFLSRAGLHEAMDTLPSFKYDLTRQAQLQLQRRSAEYQASLRHRRSITNASASSTKSVFEDKPHWQHWWIIAPSNRFKARWDIVLGALILYSAFVVPVRVGFLSDTPAWRIHDIAVDMCFAVDIALNFITAYESYNGTLVDDPSRIARHYIFSPWFTIDVCSTFPFDLISGSLIDDAASIANACYAQQSSGLGAVKLLRTVRLIRLAKVMRVLKLQQMVRSLQKSLNANPAVMQLGLIFMCIIFFTHLMGCLWFFVTQMSEESNWALAYPTYTDVLAEKAICWSTPHKYLASIYWAFTTISTIGYGDIAPVSEIEQFLALAVMLIGSAVFGVVLARMTDLITALDAAGFRKRERLDVLKGYMRSSYIPSSLHRRLRKYYTYYLDAGVNFGVQQEVLKELSPSLRTEVLLFLNKEMVAHIPFFHNQHPGFVVSVCSMLVPCFALSREYIFREGDEAHEMFFLQRGRIQIRCYQTDDTKNRSVRRWEKQQEVRTQLEEVILDEQEAVSYFGEVPLLDKTVQKREASVLAITFCSLFAFPKQHLTELLELFPTVEQILHRMTRARVTKLEETRNTVLCALSNARMSSSFALSEESSEAPRKEFSLCRRKSRDFTSPAKKQLRKVVSWGANLRASPPQANSAASAESLAPAQEPAPSAAQLSPSASACQLHSPSSAEAGANECSESRQASITKSPGQTNSVVSAETPVCTPDGSWSFVDSSESMEHLTA